MVRQAGLETLSKKHTPSSKVPFPSFCTLTAVLKKTQNNMLQISSAHRFILAALPTFCAWSVGLSQYNLTIEQSEPAAAPGTVYRFYVEANDPEDKISAVFGNDQFPLLLSVNFVYFTSVKKISLILPSPFRKDSQGNPLPPPFF